MKVKISLPAGKSVVTIIGYILIINIDLLAAGNNIVKGKIERGINEVISSLSIFGIDNILFMETRFSVEFLGFRFSLCFCSYGEKFPPPDLRIYFYSEKVLVIENIFCLRKSEKKISKSSFLNYLVFLSFVDQGDFPSVPE